MAYDIPSSDEEDLLRFLATQPGGRILLDDHLLDAFRFVDRSDGFEWWKEHATTIEDCVTSRWIERAGRHIQITERGRQMIGGPSARRNAV